MTANKQCPNCRKQIAMNYKKCPLCNHDIPEGQTKAWQTGYVVQPIASVPSVKPNQARLRSFTDKSTKGSQERD